MYPRAHQRRIVRKSFPSIKAILLSKSDIKPIFDTTHYGEEMQANHYTTEEELARELRVSQRHLINLRNRRLIPFVRLGRLIRYNRAAVEKAIQKLTVKELS